MGLNGADELRYVRNCEVWPIANWVGIADKQVLEGVPLWRSRFFNISFPSV